MCFWDGGSTSAADGLDAVTEPGSPAAGQTLSEDVDTGQTGPNFTLDLAVNQNQDAGVRHHRARRGGRASSGRPQLDGQQRRPDRGADHVR